MGKVIMAADLFCGAGGTSQGLARACERLGREVELVAVNHWPRAVATHQLNHPWARHLCAQIESLDPRKVIPGGKLDLIVAGVECTHHSRARGGRPMSDQSRASAWHVLHWAEQLRVEEVLIENVAEFLQWGPIDADGRPIPEKRGDTFRAFVAALESLNYKVEHRLLTAADYGDPTTRRRFFLRASLNGEIRWPEATHDKDSAKGREAWRTARQIIDWSNLGESIFNRKKPLAPRTVERIAEGIRRFCGEYAEPFLVMLYGSNNARSVDRPVPTVTAGGEHIGLAQPFLIPPDGPMRHDEVAAPRSVDRPLHTVRAERGGGHLVLPFLLPQDQFREEGRERIDSVDRPLRTVKASATSAAGHLVTPCIVPYYGTGVADSVEEPLATVTTKDRFGLLTPCILPMYGKTAPDSVDDPLPTVTTHEKLGLAAYMVRIDNGGSVQAPRSVDEPVGTIVSKAGIGLVRPFLLPHDQFAAKNKLALIDSVDEPLRTVTAHNGADNWLVQPFIVPHFQERIGQTPRTHSLDDPCPTVTATKGAGSLVSPTAGPGGVAVDILFRMLTPVELARAQGFPDEYQFAGTKTEVVRQIGNAVPVGLSEELCHSILEEPAA